MTCRLRWLVLCIGLVAFLPVSASSQTISGTVTDGTGAVLPGVTVEAASPALIEQTRTVVTNEAGRYSIVNLRPGVYAVTFSLPGFNTIKREGVTLTSDFTAQINAQLKVGNVQEEVTVSAASPVVDVQSAATTRVLTREVMDALPTSRSLFSFANTIPGVAPGPFGQISYRGTADAMTSVDGMRSTHMTGAGPAMTSSSFNNGQYQEYSFSTAIDSAEVGQPGLRINLVPKDGGNQFAGALYTVYSNDTWQGNNLNDDLRAQGLKDINKTIRLWDLNPSFGGPISQNKLWFQGSFRYNGNWDQAPDFYHDKSTNPLVYVPDLDNAELATNWGTTASGRLTWQASTKDKVAGFYERVYGKTPFSRSPQFGLNPPPEATVRAIGTYTNMGARWTRTHTSRLLFEAGFSNFPSTAWNDYSGVLEPWGAAHVESGLPTGRPPSYNVTELTTRRQFGAAIVAGGNVSTTQTLSGSATYVTGSHSLKGGFTLFHGTYHRPTSVAGLFTMSVRNGVPESVTLTMPGNQRENIDGDWGMYVQDRWSVKRLTMNMGLRYDWLRTSVPDERLPASPWLPETRFAAIDVLNFKDISPRLSAAYDLFGNGKTALKVGFGRFVAGETVGLTFAANPIATISTADTRPWQDINGDKTILNENGTVQWDELGPSNNANFGKNISTRTFNDDVLRGWFKRGYSWETNVGIQQEVLPRMAVTALYYRRTTGNQRVDDNTLVDPASFDQFCVTGPSDPRLPGGGGERICGLSDLKGSARGLIANYNTFASDLGNGKGFTDLTTGYEFNVNARLPRGAFLQGGVDLNRRKQDGSRAASGVTIQPCSVIDDPGIRFCETQSKFRPDVKLNGSYILPWQQIQVSATYRGLAGAEVNAVLSIPSASLVDPAGAYQSTLGRGLTSGTSKSILLTEPGLNFLPMTHTVDLRLAKTFTVQRWRMQVQGDFQNLFNSNAVLGVNSTFNPLKPSDWQRPSDIQSPRQFKLGAQIDF